MRSASPFVRALLVAALVTALPRPALAIVAQGGGNAPTAPDTMPGVQDSAPEPAMLQPHRPQPQALQLPDKLDIQSHTLPNGLRLLMVEDHKAPVVSFHVWYQVGSRDEHTGITGSSHLLEHMMFQGARKYGKGKFDETLLQYGGQNNAFTTENFTAFYETLASDRLEVAFDLESDRMEDALMSAQQLKSEKEVVKEELRWRSDNSSVGATWEALVSHMFVSSTLHWPVGGWPSDVSNVTREEVYKHYRTYYRPDNAIVIISGDFQPAEAVHLANRYFGRLQPGKTFPRSQTEELAQTGERRVELEKQVDTPVVLAGFRVPNAKSPDMVPLALLDLVLNGGESSRLYRDLIYTKRIAGSVDSDLERGKDFGEFYVLGQPLPGKSAEDVEGALEEELARVSAQEVTAKELLKAKNMALARYVFARESAEGLAMELGTTASLSSPEEYNDYLDQLQAATPADLQRVAKTYLTKRNRTVVTLRPATAPAPTAVKGGK